MSYPNSSIYQALFHQRKQVDSNIHYLRLDIHRMDDSIKRIKKDNQYRVKLEIKRNRLVSFEKKLIKKRRDIDIMSHKIMFYNE